MNKWNFNGMVIQDLSDNNNCQRLSPYNGLGRYLSWPLSNWIDETSKRITVEAEERWFGYCKDNEFALAVVPSREFIENYISICRSKSINTRILCLETDRDNPQCQEPVPNTVFLGYDYATSQDFFSALYDDLYGLEIPPSLVKYKAALNPNGLLGNEDDLISYVKDRNIAIEQGYELEAFGDFCIYRISIV